MRFLLVGLIGLSILLGACNTSDDSKMGDKDSTQTGANILPSDLIFTTVTGETTMFTTLIRVDAQTTQISPFYVDDSDFIRSLSWSPSGNLLAVLRWATQDYLEICLVTSESVLRSCFEDKIVRYAFRERGQNYMVTWSQDERYLYFVTDYGQYHRVYDVIESWGASLVEADVATGKTRRTLHQAEIAHQLPALIYWTDDLHYVESLPPGEAPKIIDLWQNQVFLLPQEIPDLGHLKFCPRFSPQGQYLTARTYQNDTLSGWALLTPDGQIVQTVGSDKLQQAGISWMECPVWQSDEAAFYFLGGVQGAGQDEVSLFKYVLVDQSLVNVKPLYPSDPQGPIPQGNYPTMPIRLAPDNATLAITFLIPGATEVRVLMPAYEWLTYGGEAITIPVGADPIWFPVANSD